MTLIFKTGRLSAIIAFMAVLGYGIAQVMQVSGSIDYPWDERLIYGFSLCIAIPFLVMVVALHHTMPSYKKIWSGIAVTLSTAYAVFALLVYMVQLTVVLPAPPDDHRIDVLKMYPHSLFWALDALAYLCMGLAVLFLVPALSHIRAARPLRSLMIAHVIMTVISMIVYFSPDFSTTLLLIASPWLFTACGICVGLAVYFGKGRTLYMN